ncbi:MAG TPA: hypothetical protein QGF50_05905, partial [Roseibacillus sp.]|nr:hypothetical protein [Roseibacillus sp.]
MAKEKKEIKSLPGISFLGLSGWGSGRREGAKNRVVSPEWSASDHPTCGRSLWVVELSLGTLIVPPVQ